MMQITAKKIKTPGDVTWAPQCGQVSALFPTCLPHDLQVFIPDIVLSRLNAFYACIHKIEQGLMRLYYLASIYGHAHQVNFSPDKLPHLA